MYTHIYVCVDHLLFCVLFYGSFLGVNVKRWKMCRKRNIHIIRGREVMSIRRCACFVVYTRGVSPTYFATQTIMNPFHYSFFGSEGSYIEMFMLMLMLMVETKKKHLSSMIHISAFSPHVLYI